MEVSIQAKHLKAAAVFSASHDIRYYLHGVLAEVRAKETRLVATDGSCAVVLRDQVIGGDQPDMPDVIIPNATVKLALSMKKDVLPLQLNAEGNWTLGGIEFSPIEALFPDYRRVMVSETSGEVGNFDFELLGRFLKAAKALGSRQTPVLRQNGENGAQVQIYGFEDEFIGVIMPMRMFNGNRQDPGISTWGGSR